MGGWLAEHAVGALGILCYVAALLMMEIARELLANARKKYSEAREVYDRALELMATKDTK